MPQVCKVCSHPKSAEIDRLLVRGEPNTRIAAKFKLREQSIRCHRKTHFADYLEKALTRAKENNELSLKSELVFIFGIVRGLVTAANKMLVDRRTGEINLQKKNAITAANLVLKASDKLDRHLRMLGDLTGEFKAPQTNPKDVSERLYNEWVDSFLKIFERIDPTISRKEVVQVLKDMPETAGEFMPMVKSELQAWVN